MKVADLHFPTTLWADSRYSQHSANSYLFALYFCTHRRKYVFFFVFCFTNIESVELSVVPMLQQTSTMSFESDSNRTAAAVTMMTMMMLHCCLIADREAIAMRHCRIYSAVHLAPFRPVTLRLQKKHYFV